MQVRTWQSVKSAKISSTPGSPHALSLDELCVLLTAMEDINQDVCQGDKSPEVVRIKIKHQTCTIEVYCKYKDLFFVCLKNYFSST